MQSIPLRCYGQALIPASARFVGYGSIRAQLPTHSPFASFAQKLQQLSILHRPASQFSSRKMSDSAKPPSDDMYAAFLDQANRDPCEGIDNTTTNTAVDVEPNTTPRTVSEAQSIPECLTSVDAYYVSDADEPFTPFALEYPAARDGKWPTTEQFHQLIFPKSKDGQLDVSSSPTDTFRYAYSNVLQAVGASASVSEEECRAYRVEYGPTKFEYWIAALDRANGRIVGMKALAFES